MDRKSYKIHTHGIHIGEANPKKFAGDWVALELPDGKVFVAAGSSQREALELAQAKLKAWEEDEEKKVAAEDEFEFVEFKEVRDWIVSTLLKPFTVVDNRVVATDDDTLRFCVEVGRSNDVWVNVPFRLEWFNKNVKEHGLRHAQDVLGNHILYYILGRIK